MGSFCHFARMAHSGTFWHILAHRSPGLLRSHRSLRHAPGRSAAEPGDSPLHPVGFVPRIRVCAAHFRTPPHTANPFRTSSLVNHPPRALSGTSTRAFSHAPTVRVRDHKRARPRAKP